MSLSWVIVLKLSKIVRKCEKPKVAIAIYVYASESSCFALLENGNGYLYYAMTWSLIGISDGYKFIA